MIVLIKTIQLSMIFINVFVKMKLIGGWLGWAMVLGSFHCWGVQLLWHIIGQGPAVLAAGEGRVGFFFFFFHLIYRIFLF